MNIQQLEYIIALDRFKNFTRAAEHCHVTQATLSAMIKKLEEELDLILFDRKSNPVITTECGKDILHEARKLMVHVENIKHLPGMVKKNIVGRFRMGIIPTVANALLPLIIKPLASKFPKLSLEWIEITTEPLLEHLKDGVLDGGIMATPVNDKEIEEKILYYEKLMVYGQTEAQGTYLLPDAIKDDKVWLLEKGNCLRSQFINLCELEKKNLSKPFRFEPNSLETVVNLVERLGGLTLIPELYQQNLPKARQKKVADFKPPFPVREISLVYFRPYAKSRIIEGLSEQITSIIKPRLASSHIRNSDLSIVRT